MESIFTVTTETTDEAVHDLFVGATRLYVHYIQDHRASLLAAERGDEDEAERLERKGNDNACAHVAYCMCISRLVKESLEEVMDASRTVGKLVLARL